VTSRWVYWRLQYKPVKEILPSSDILLDITLQKIAPYRNNDVWKLLLISRIPTKAFTAEGSLHLK
jgi:hypothetical protein